MPLLNYTFFLKNYCNSRNNQLCTCDKLYVYFYFFEVINTVYKNKTGQVNMIESIGKTEATAVVGVGENWKNYSTTAEC